MPGRTQQQQTGGNTEPMPFRRTFGGASTDNGAATDGFPTMAPMMTPMQTVLGSFGAPGGHLPPQPPQMMAAQPPPPPPPVVISPIPPTPSTVEGAESKKKDKKRDKDSKRKRSRSRSRSRDRKRRSSKRSGSRDRKRSRSRDRHDKRRGSGDRDRSKRSRDRREGSAENHQSLAAVVPPTPAPAPLQSIPPEVAAELAKARSITEKKRNRKSRWGTEKSFVPGMPTMLPSSLSDEQTTMYLNQLTIEDATRKLRCGDLGIDPDPLKRSPSPEPVYDMHGKRLNTREVRTRQKLEQLRHEKIQELLKLNPLYKAPSDYKPPVVRLSAKVWIPQDDHPEINFVGLLIGPRGNTLKSLEKDTGARIIIRGKGSVKEGKILRPGGQPLPGEDEPLHAYITSSDPEIIDRATKKLEDVIAEAVEIPDGQNELRKLQLRELALLNGTLRPEDLASGTHCANCGENTHRTWECHEAANVTARTICNACGGAGHLTRDCRNPRPGWSLMNEGDGSGGGVGGPGGLDEEYSALMGELGLPGGDSLASRGPLSRSAYGGEDDDEGMRGGYGGADRGGFGGRGGFRGRGRGRGFIPSGVEPIVKINLAINRPKPPSLLGLDLAPGSMPPPPPWGFMPPGMMGEGGEHMMGYPMPMPGFVPPPPSMYGDSGMVPPPWAMAPPPPPPMPVPPPSGAGGGSPPPPPPPPTGDSGIDLTSLIAPPPPPPE